VPAAGRVEEPELHVTGAFENLLVQPDATFIDERGADIGGAGDSGARQRADQQR
jgi:hypothetical protein